MTMDLTSLTEAELGDLVQRAQEEIARRKDSRKLKLRDEIESQLRGTGLDIADLFPDLAKKSGKRPKVKIDGDDEARKSVAPKFKHPVSGETWSGRGPRPPEWVKKELIDRGWTIDQFKAAEDFQF